MNSWQPVESLFLCLGTLKLLSIAMLCSCWGRHDLHYFFHGFARVWLKAWALDRSIVLCWSCQMQMNSASLWRTRFMKFLSRVHMPCGQPSPWAACLSAHRTMMRIVGFPGAQTGAGWRQETSVVPACTTTPERDVQQGLFAASATCIARSKIHPNERVQLGSCGVRCIEPVHFQLRATGKTFGIDFIV